MDTYVHVTNVHAYTCDGLYSDWNGTGHIKQTMTNMIREQQTVFEEDRPINFTLYEPEEADEKPSYAKINGNTITYTMMKSAYFSGDEHLKGVAVKGAPECSQDNPKQK